MLVPSNNNLSVGNLPVDFSKKDFKQLTDDAALLQTKDNDPKEWATLNDNVSQSGTIGNDQMDNLKKFASTVGTGKDSLKSSYIQVLMDRNATPAQKNEAKARLADVNCFLGGFNNLTDALKYSTGKAAVEALAGASFGPTGVLVAYQASATLPKAELQGVMDNISGMRNGTAPFIYKDNKITQMHQEALWQGINQQHDAAIASANAGKPMVVASQVYEMTSPQELGKNAQSARAGNLVLLNLDPARITAPPRGKEIEFDDGPDKLRCMLQLMNAGCGVSTYPCQTKLGDAADLMHRKGYQAGDDFILSGMNSNDGSGENIDRGYKMTGPAAHRKGQDLIRDVKDSFANPTLEDRYGAKNLEAFPTNVVKVGTRGLGALIDAMGNGEPAPAGTVPPKFSNSAELSAYATSKGLNLTDLIKGSPDALFADHGQVELSDKGKQMCLDLMKKVNDRVNDPANVKLFDGYKLPSDAAAGGTTVTLADVPTERQATALETIQGAEKFIDAPTFVITKPIASAIAAKAKEMSDAGKPFEVRMVADSGIYPDGSTPNKTGITLLEDAGLRPRWTMLPRSGDHDRKIHAKDILTDKSEWFGSTNLSSKGMRENWEQSGVISFDPKDPDSMKLRQHGEDLFNDLWDNMSFECNSKDVATYLVKDKYHYKGRDMEAEIDRNRGKVIDSLIANLETYEKESGAFVHAKAQDPQVQSRIKALTDTGMDEGNATLVSVAESMGKDNFYKALNELPSRKKLDAMLPPKQPGH